ncbi:nudix hydrolase 18, mitochondrial-like [Salvia hispanica]|uniref:nudix hydrolase 18, mitochondrial-like n=1 Tax=Salvia hispanica TaxID=49212 RepID=UPI00200941A5|nr:nudix hydrolase 18, mitochondrial-like [Salvia hispanica]
MGKEQEPPSMDLKHMVALVSRTGRHMQRYNFLGHRQVVGCIPYRYRGKKPPCVVDGEEIEVLVITSQRKEKGMLFPKGGWEIDETIEAAALRETVEEAGVVGDVECKLGKWNFKSKSSETSYEGHMFPLLVKEQLEFWPEKDVRQRLWVSVREARKVCQYWWMKEALELLVGRLSAQAKADTKSNL